MGLSLEFPISISVAQGNGKRKTGIILIEKKNSKTADESEEAYLIHFVAK